MSALHAQAIARVSGSVKKRVVVALVKKPDDGSLLLDQDPQVEEVSLGRFEPSDWLVEHASSA